jgi:very-short-patch-repair endonuclease
LSLAIKAARILRKRMTPSERRVYALVRNRKFMGLKFLRQHPIKVELDGKWRFFVADFYLAEKKLVLEIDGAVHDNQQEYDTLRTWIISQLGMRVIRIKNEDTETLAKLLKKLRECVEEKD